MLPGMQFGSKPGQRCTSAVLKKVLCHDHIRMLKQTAVFVENDAVGCYDRLINNLILMVLKNWACQHPSPICWGASGTPLFI
jgi:hypothetical protein